MVLIKKIIPFEKELLFNTKVCEITSISLEHHITKIEEDLISGYFHINGDYKMTEGSITREKFDYNINFDIALDNRFDTKNIVVDIDDFTYKIVNDEILKVNIDLYIDGNLIENSLIVTKPEIITKELKEENIEIEREEKQEEKNEQNNRVIDENSIILEDNIFGNINNNETYATYYVYIIKEDDTIDKIMDKYSISKEDISKYNEIESIKPGDKIIIPTLTNGQ